MSTRVAHVVRAYGGITEPFIEQRVRAAGVDGELWYERATRLPADIQARRVAASVLIPGNLIDRAFHVLPSIGRLSRAAYARADAAARVDVVHAHYLTTAHLVVQATKRPVVASAYGFDVTAMARRQLWRRAFGNLARRLSAVLVEGPFMQQLVVRLGFPSKNVLLVPIAAALDEIPYRNPRLPNGAIRLLISGRLVPKKGHDIAIRAFAQVADRLPPGSQLAIVGDGELRRPLEALARSTCGSAVEFLGKQPRERYLAEVRRAHLVLAPSRTAPNGDAEGGAPTTILDAQATGTPVIGSTHADIPYLIRDAETGYLSREGDVASLAATIVRAIADAAQWPAVTQAARQQVESRHSDTAITRLLADVHARALAG